MHSSFFLFFFVDHRSLKYFTRRYASHATAVKEVNEHINHELDGIREAGTWKGERVITSKQGATIHVAGSKQDILNFCANNYLGLSVRIYRVIVYRIVSDCCLTPIQQFSAIS